MPLSRISAMPFGGLLTWIQLGLGIEMMAKDEKSLGRGEDRRIGAGARM